MITFLLAFLFSVSPALAGDRTETGRILPYHGVRLPKQLVVKGRAPEVAVYDDKGSWDAGVQGYEHLLKKLGVTYRAITAKDLLGGALQSGGFHLLYMPGGESWQYLSDLGEAGAKQVRAFVQNGGSYVGICAGAFYATSDRQGGHATGPYGIGLLQGTAYDGTALGTAPFVDGTLPFELTDDPLVAGFAHTFDWLLLGGPSFHYTAAEAQRKDLRVLAKFSKIEEPAAIVFDYGAGRVFLSAPHIEVEPGTIDPDTGPEQEEGWPVLTRATGFVLHRTFDVDWND